MSKRELRALVADGRELSDSESRLRSSRGKKRKTIVAAMETESTAGDVKALKERVTELEARLEEALKAIRDKGVELDSRTVALEEARGRADRERDDAERARKESDELRSKVTRERDDAERARKESDELRSKVTTLEKERDELKSRTDSSAGGKDASVLASLEKFIEAQTKMMSDHARALTVQNFPSLPQFTGEEIDSEERSFERWHAKFEERAVLAGWEDKQKLHQLKFLLSKTALRVFEIMPESQRAEYADSSLISACKRMRPLRNWVLT